MERRTKKMQWFSAQVVFICILALSLFQSAFAFTGVTHKKLTWFSWNNTPGAWTYSDAQSGFYSTLRDTTESADGSSDTCTEEYGAGDCGRYWQSAELLGGDLYVGYHGFVNGDYNYEYQDNDIYQGEGFLLSEGDSCPAHYSMHLGGPSYYYQFTYQGDTRLVAALELLDKALQVKYTNPILAAKYLGVGLHFIQDYFAHLDAGRLYNGGDHRTGLSGYWADLESGWEWGHWKIDYTPYDDPGYYTYDVHSGSYASWYESSWVHTNSYWTSAWRFQAAEAMGERYAKSFINDTPWHYLDGNGIWGTYGGNNAAYSHYFNAYIPTDKLDNYMWTLFN